jgi:hypothetical protein
MEASQGNKTEIKKPGGIALGVECLPSMCEALDPIPRRKKRKVSKAFKIHREIMKSLANFNQASLKN